MIPGLGGDPRQMSMMMRKLGIRVDELDDVQEIVIRTPTKDYVFEGASVSIMKAQGVETWQISGTPRVEEHDVQLKVSEDDVRMVALQTGCDEQAARATLQETGGDLAEAIVRLSD